MCLLEHWSSFVLQGFMGSIEEGLNRIVEAITPRGLGGHGPRKVKVSNNNIIIININFNNNSKFLVVESWYLMSKSCMNGNQEPIKWSLHLH